MTLDLKLMWSGVLLLPLLVGRRLGNSPRGDQWASLPLVLALAGFHCLGLSMGSQAILSALFLVLYGWIALGSWNRPVI